MPASPTDGETHTFTDNEFQWTTNALTIDANAGQQIEDVALTPGNFGASTLLTTQGSVTFQYDLVNTRWIQV